MNLLTRFRKHPFQTLPSRHAYAQWAKTYPAEAHNVLMQVEQTALLDLMPPMQQSRVLDLGCGTGRWGKLALANEATEVIGFDNSLPMLRAGILTSKRTNSTCRSRSSKAAFTCTNASSLVSPSPTQPADARRSNKAGPWHRRARWRIRWQ